MPSSSIRALVNKQLDDNIKWDFQKSFLEMMRADHQKDVLDVLSSGVINDDVTAIIEKVAADTAQPFKVNE